ncbi:MAG: Pr6Pr family membrane protein, partial [Geodermatophilaceae bacterium]|nr:Pr6Pr family membrane protein [Geodermatophilaceae bacterium]
VISGGSLLLQLVLVVIGDADTLLTRLIRLVSFFTVESNLIVTVVAFTLARDPGRDGRGWRVVRLAGVLGIAITGVVYVTVLRGLVELSPAGRVADIGLHYLTPALVVVGWLLYGPRPRVDLPSIGLALVFPVAWLGYTLVRGEVVDAYPYPFVDVIANGYPTVLLNCLLVTLLFLAVAALALFVDRRMAPAPRPGG